jgi:hypothetical protein
VQWRHESVPDDKVKVSLDVEDTGIGIPAQSESTEGGPIVLTP